MNNIADTAETDTRQHAATPAAMRRVSSPLDAVTKFVRMRVINRYLVKNVLTAFLMSLMHFLKERWGFLSCGLGL